MVPISVLARHPLVVTIKGVQWCLGVVFTWLAGLETETVVTIRLEVPWTGVETEYMFLLCLPMDLD